MKKNNLLEFSLEMINNFLEKEKLEFDQNLNLYSIETF